MFIDIEEYIKKSREERRAHLKLDEDCILIGGHSSTVYKGLLAHSLGTTIPTRCKPRLLLCHACNVSGCSNPNHLYWGRDIDNHLDQVENGTYKTINERTVAKYGVTGDKFRDKSRRSLMAGD